MTNSVPFVLMRGGTSKGVFLKAMDVPQGHAALASFLLNIFGSPDRRQIDGLGGADKLTSKAAIIGAPIREGTDVTYLFGQVSILAPEVDFNLNCGNLTAAVGAYAVEEGFVRPVEGTTRVRIHNLNTDKIIVAEVPVQDGRPVTEGDLQIAGVPGTGAPISLDFRASAGAITGRILPLGSPRSIVEVPDLGAVEVTVVDAANLVAFVAAESLGMRGDEDPTEIDTDSVLVGRINALRRAVAHAVGIGEYFDSRVGPSTPFCGVVQRPKPYRTFNSNELIEAEDSDLLVRLYASASTHRALAATATACTGVACRIPGSIPNELLSEAANDRSQIRIGHPSGVIQVESAVRVESDKYTIEAAKIFRTARRIAEGRTFLRTYVEGGGAS